MKKNVSRIIIISLALVFIFCANIFSAVVSDNDGSAFITKAEFDSLKNNFQSQLDQYNTSIDNKIDSAIAGYLAGISMARTDNLTLDSNTKYSYPIVMMSSTDLWNNPKSEDYYNLVRNRVRFTRYDYVAFTFNSGTTTPTPNVSIWTSDEDATLHTVDPLASVTANALIYGFLQNGGREIKGKSAPLYNIKTTSSTRRIGSTNYKVFDIDNYGIGYQYLDYKPRFEVYGGKNAGHFGSDNSNRYAYCAVLGDYNNSKTSPTPANWTETYFLTNGSGWNNASLYDQKVPSYIGTKLKISNIPEWYGHGNGGVTFDNQAIDSSTFVWDSQNIKTMLYAGTANVPAQLTNRFGFEPDFSDGANTIVECVDIQQVGYNVGWAYNPTSTAKNTGKFLARTSTYMPPMKAIIYDGYSNSISTLPSFSALPATCIRYYDDEKKVHYMDEGMFLTNFKKDGTVDFEVKFETKSGVKTLNFYVSKQPFSRENGKTKLANFKVDKGTTTYTSKSLSTGTTYHITVDGIKSGEQLYVLWEPETSGEYIALSEFTKFTITSEN